MRAHNLGRVRCRSIYAATAVDDPVARRIIQACVQAGEQARRLPHVPMKIKLADHSVNDGRLDRRCCGFLPALSAVADLVSRIG